MNQWRAKAFAEAIDKEVNIIAEVFDGTVGADNFRSRIATCYYAIAIFQMMTGVNPAAFLNGGLMPSLEPENKSDGG